MADLYKKLKVAVAAVGLVLGVVAGNSPANAASSVEDDAQSSNTLVSTQVAPAAATTTGGIVASAVGSAIGGGIGGGPAPGAPTASLGFGQVAKAPDGKLVGKFFNSRDIAGRSAGSKNPRLGVWLQGAYTAVDNDESGGQFDGGIFNVVAGIDYKPKKLKDRAVIGIAVAWEDVDVDTDFNTGTFEGSGFTVAPYIGVKLTKNFSVDASVGYSNLDYDNSRNTAGLVTGSFDADRIFGSINLTGNWHKKRVRFTPKLGVLGLWEEQDSYTDSTGVAVGKSTIHLGRASFGGEVGFRIKAVEPFVGATGYYDFNRNSPVTLTTGQTASDDAFGGIFAVGVNFARKNVSGQIKGETNQFKNEVSTYTVSGRVRVNF